LTGILSDLVATALDYSTSQISKLELIQLIRIIIGRIYTVKFVTVLKNGLFSRNFFSNIYL